MDQAHENAGASAPAEVQKNETPVEDTGAESAPEVSGGWGKALEAFEEVDGDFEQKAEPEAPAAEESESKSHFEQDKPQKADGLNLDTLRVPPKYKDRIKEFVAPLVEEHQRKAEAAQETVGQYHESNQSILGVLKEIAADPSKLIDYTIQYGEQIGLDADTVNHYRGMKSGNARPAPQPQTHQQQQDSIKTISAKYRDKLLQAKTGDEFADIQEMRDAELAQVIRGETLGMLKQLLGGYHEKAISPLLKDRESQAKEVARAARSTTWTKSTEAIASKYKDFSGYKDRVIEKLSQDPRYRNLVAQLNENPAVAKQNGITHEWLVEQGYLELSQAERLKELTAPKPKQWQGGLQPNAKHITTTRTGTAGNWDAIKDLDFV